MLKNISFGKKKKKKKKKKKNGTKNVLFFLSQAPTHHSFNSHVIIPFKIKVIEKPYTVLVPLILSYYKKF